MYLSERNSLFLLSLFNHFNKTYPIKNKYQISKLAGNINKNLNNNKFVSTRIKTYIQNQCRNSFKITSNKINIFWAQEAEKFRNYQLLNKILKTIYSIKELTKNDKPLNIYLYLTPFKKQFPNNGQKILGADEINSGSTIVFYDKNRNGDISIWRKEEFHKVLVHELLHAFKYDFNFTSEIDKLIGTHFNIKKEININESYTEMMALIFYSMIKTVGEKKKFNNFINLLDQELVYSLRQGERIMNYYNFDSYQQLRGGKKEFKQETGIFSYYILKTALLLNFNNFCNFMRESCINQLIFPEKNHIKYCQLIFNSYDSMTNINLHKNRKIKGSLRMTLHG